MITNLDNGRPAQPTPIFRRDDVNLMNEALARARCQQLLDEAQAHRLARRIRLAQRMERRARRAARRARRLAAAAVTASSRI